MQKLACEMCGSTNVVKEEGLFICQSCGTKYSPEEAKKIMTGEVVDVKGIVKVDNSSEIENLRKLSKRAKDNVQWKEVAEYSVKILHIDPDDWEAVFDKELAEAWISTYNDQNSEFSDLITASESALRIIEDKNIDIDIDKVKANFSESINHLCVATYSATLNNYVNNPTEEMVYILWQTLQSCISLTEFALNFAKLDEDLKISMYSSIVTYSSELSLSRTYVWGYNNQTGADVTKTLEINDEIRAFAVGKYNEYLEKVKINEPNYQPPEIRENSGGCYIATYVYGSYDCPEVWTLRRFRDNYLDNRLYGKLFIKIYYAISPTLVKLFGNKRWFKKLFKFRLDKFVRKLQDKGIESSHYTDS